MWEVAWRDRDRFDPARFEAWPWLLGIARHVAHRHRLARERSVEAEVDADESGQASPEATALLRAQVAILLAPLSLPAREVILMHFVLGYRVEEIAEKLDLSDPAVAKRITRTLKFLRERSGGVDAPPSEPPASAPADG